MKEYPEFHTYPDYDLLLIAFIQNVDWDEEAVQYAKCILKERGLTDENANKQAEIIKNELAEQLKQDTIERNEESYSIFELFFIIIFWWRYIFWDWNLKKEGYLNKSKQRKKYIFFGVILYLIMIAYSELTNEDSEVKKERIEQKAISDHKLSISKDWSGLYVFEDTATIENKQKLVNWNLKINKGCDEHTVILDITNENQVFTIGCVGIAKDNVIRILPDTNYILPSGEPVSYYDKLFTLEEIDGDTYVIWGAIKPFNYNGNLSVVLFRKVE